MAGRVAGRRNGLQSDSARIHWKAGRVNLIVQTDLSSSLWACRIGALLLASALAGVSCDGVRIDAVDVQEPALQGLHGKWQGTAVYGDPTREGLRLELDLNLEPDGPVVLGGGWAAMHGDVDDLVTLDVYGTMEDSLLTLAFYPPPAGFFLGLRGRFVADSIRGELTTSGIYPAGSPPMRFDLVRAD